MKPGPKSRKSKFLPPQVISELVQSSSTYLSEILKAVSSLIEEETDDKKKETLSQVQEVAVKERANFRILSRQINHGTDFVFHGEGAKVEMKEQNLFTTLPTKMAEHLAAELQGWSLHLERPEMFHFSHVAYKPASKEFFCDCIVTLIQKPSDLERVFVSVVYLNATNDKQLGKQQRFSFPLDELSIALIPLLKSTEGRYFVQPAYNSAGFADDELEAAATVKEEAVEAPDVVEGKRKRPSRFSKEFIVEAMELEAEEVEGGRQEAEAEVKRVKRIKGWEKEDKDFTLRPQIEADAEGNEDLIEDDAVMGKCRDCQQVLTMKESLTHMNEKHAQDIEKNLDCPLCGSSPESLEGHLRTSHNPHLQEFTCDICLRTFNDGHWLQRHKVNKHFPELKTETCPTCSFRFVDTQSLRQHIRVMHGGPMGGTYKPKTFICFVCGKGYLSQRNLDSHLANQHNAAPKDHPCNYCEKQFASAKCLRRHLQHIHTDKRDLICSECNKGFKTKANLRQHQVSHKPPKHQCNYCEKLFLYKAGLHIHMKNVHGIDFRTGRATQDIGPSMELEDKVESRLLESQGTMEIYPSYHTFQAS